MSIEKKRYLISSWIKSSSFGSVLQNSRLQGNSLRFDLLITLTNSGLLIQPGGMRHHATTGVASPALRDKERVHYLESFRIFVILFNHIYAINRQYGRRFSFQVFFPSDRVRRCSTNAKRDGGGWEELCQPTFGKAQRRVWSIYRTAGSKWARWFVSKLQTEWSE